MKINEIIVESRSQLDEGVMDTIKSKLAGVYQMARKKYPNFDEAFTIAKSHKAEINDIIEQLKTKKKTGKVSKEDVIAAVMPLSKKVAAEVGAKDGINENQDRTNNQFAGAVVGATLGLITAIFMLFNIDGHVSGYLLLGIPLLSVILGGTIGSEMGKSGYDNENKRKSNMSSQQLEREELQKEYRRLERRYQDQDRRGKMSYSDTRRMEELYNQGYR